MLRFAAVAWALLAGLAAQAVPARFECHPVAGAPTTVFTVTFRHGFDDDPAADCGAARVLADCRLERGRRAFVDAGGVRLVASGVHVAADLTVVFAQVAADEWSAGAALVRAVLDDGATLAEDVLRLVVARAALDADDAEWLYPGLVLQSRARMALFCDRRARGVQGSAAALQKLVPERVCALLRRPVATDLMVFGSVPGDLRALGFELAPALATPLAPPDAGPPAAVPAETTHPRIDAPYAAIAFPCPAIERLPEFAVAIEIARARAARAFAGSAQQTLARAPIVAWSWLDGDPAVVFCRRGRPDDAVATPFAELDRFLADLRGRPPNADEVASARRSLLAVTSPVPWTDELVAALRRSPAALTGRALAAAQARARGITGARIVDVTAASAHAALADTLAPEREWRGALVPVPRREPAWRR